MEHKYRAWDPCTKKMDNDCRDSLSFWNGLVVPEGDHIPLRWTGLKDKNGKEIYEGDVLTVVGVWKEIDGGDDAYAGNTRNVEVHWYSGMFILKPKILALCQYEQEDIEVIGSIYENPELLTERLVQ